MLSPRFHRTETTPYKYHELHDGDHERYAFGISSSDKTVNQATPMKEDAAGARGTDDLVGVRVRKHFRDGVTGHVPETPKEVDDGDWWRRHTFRTVVC